MSRHRLAHSAITSVDPATFFNVICGRALDGCARAGARLTGKIAFDVGTAGCWTLDLDAGTTVEAFVPDAGCRIYVDADTFGKVMKGTSRMADGIRAGQIIVRGELSLLDQLATALETAGDR